MRLLLTAVRWESDRERAKMRRRRVSTGAAAARCRMRPKSGRYKLCATIELATHFRTSPSTRERAYARGLRVCVRAWRTAQRPWLLPNGFRRPCSKLPSLLVIQTLPRLSTASPLPEKPVLKVSTLAGSVAEIRRRKRSRWTDRHRNRIIAEMTGLRPRPEPVLSIFTSLLPAGKAGRLYRQ